MAEFINIWSNSGWLANLVTIVLGVITVFGGGYSIYRRFKSYLESENDYSSVVNYVRSNYEYDSIAILKKRKVAIIDDQPENYPVDYLRRSGFNISVYEEVSLSNYYFIDSYDLVFLDITNVVKEDPKRGGFELIKRIRSEMNGIVIIGVSSKRFDPTLTEFFRLADETAKTPISEKDCEELLLGALEKYYSPIHISGKIDELLNDSMLSQKHHKKALKLIERYINLSVSDDYFYGALSGLNKNLDVYKLHKKCQSLKDVL
ncbi:hypothetical protein [Halopseudomonas oceani]|uniref:hypothetical protein n=1 Tax=Halopseudomonas oceani TaxID=1708783 RepID=UPI002AA5FB43|nr:hypothetical protein [Halopseudomonas oceani]